MSWSEVKKINSDLNLPLDSLLKSVPMFNFLSASLSNATYDYDIFKLTSEKGGFIYSILFPLISFERIAGSISLVVEIDGEERYVITGKNTLTTFQMYMPRLYIGNGERYKPSWSTTSEIKHSFIGKSFMSFASVDTGRSNNYTTTNIADSSKAYLEIIPIQKPIYFKKQIRIYVKYISGKYSISASSTDTYGLLEYSLCE